VLEVKNINVYYGAIHAIKDVSFEVREGEVVSLIGANGAGKTTILHTISGLLRPQSGEITFRGQKIDRMEAHKIVRLGLAHVPEGRRVFAKMTVQENLEMGAFIRNDIEELQKDIKKVFDRFPRLEERKRQLAGTLSGGEQQMLAMGRAMMSRPTLMMLDEPSMGLAPLLVNEIFDIVKTISQDGTTVLLVEQNANKALAIADRGYVLETGNVVLADDAENLLSNEQVKEAYLGG
jgi:ABC-type branched-chain amino acid transport systems, ATPase component